MSVELYRFTSGDRVWTYTATEAPQSHNGETYAPVAVGRSEIQARNELSKANLDIRVDAATDFARYLMTKYLEQIVGLTLFEKNGATFDTIWKGRLANVKPGTAEVTLSFESIFTSLRRPGLRARYQRPCRHALYGRGCGLNKDDFAIPGRLGAMSGDTIQVYEAAGYPNGYFSGGMVEAPDGTLRFILGHLGDTLTLSRPHDSLIELRAQAGWGVSYGGQYGGVKVILYPGCDRMKETCLSKFNNLANFGGFPYIPSKNPFGGSSIA